MLEEVLDGFTWDKKEQVFFPLSFFFFFKWRSAKYLR